MKNNAIYPGSFNPFHDGHKSILVKALKVFNIVYIVVAQNPDKEKNDIIKNINVIKSKISDLKNVKIINGENKLIVDIAQKMNVKFLIRSLRNNQDLDFEIDLASGNKILDPEIETVFFLSDTEYRNYSSSLIKSQKDKNV